MKISIKIALLTGACMIAVTISELLIEYKYFKLDYELTAVAVLFLIAGMYLSKKAEIIIKPERLYYPLKQLTAKELQILELIYDGRTNKEIAALNFVEVSTVKTHINNLYAKLKARNRSEASKIYAEYHIKAKSTLSPLVAG